MTSVKQFIFAIAASAMFFTSTTNLQAEECCIDQGGCAYNECCRSSSLAPAIALGTIALIAIVAVAVQNTSGHAHCHSH